MQANHLGRQATVALQRGTNEMNYINPPTHCDFCRVPIVATFYDAKTHEGPWANMCPSCYKQHGRGLGIGLGQKYERQADSDRVYTKVS